MTKIRRFLDQSQFDYALWFRRFLIGVVIALAIYGAIDFFEYCWDWWFSLKII